MHTNLNYFDEWWPIVVGERNEWMDVQKEEEMTDWVLKHTVSWSFIINVIVSCGKWGHDKNAARYFESTPGEETICNVVILFAVDSKILLNGWNMYLIKRDASVVFVRNTSTWDVFQWYGKNF